MGVVHLARRGDGQRVALKVLRPHIVGDDEARRRLAREVGSLSRVRSQWVAEIVDADPWAPIPYVATRYVPGALAARPRARGGADRGRRPALVRRLPRRGRRVGPRGRRAAPRHQAVERADGGPDADPHRLRPGPGRRRPEADPHRLAARHARLPRARDPVRRRRDHRLRRPLLGGDRRLRRHRHGRRSAAARRWRSWTGSAAASTTSPASPSRCASCSPLRSTPTPQRRPTLDAILGWLRPQVARTPRPPAAAAARRTSSTMPYAAAARRSPDARSTDVLPGASRRSARTARKRLTEHQTVMRAAIRRAVRLRRRAAQPSRAVPPVRRTGPARDAARRSARCCAAASCAAYPWYGSVTLLLLGLAAAQRLAGRQRGGRPAPVRGTQVVRRRRSCSSAPRGTWSGRSPATCCSLLWSLGLAARRGAALLRVRRRRRR